MFIKNFIKIIFGSLVYPIVNLPRLLVPFLVTLAVCLAIGYVAFTFNVEALTKGLEGMGLAMVLLNIILVLFFLLAIIPLLASVTRHIVLSEKIDMIVLGSILNKREFSILYAWLKVFFVYLLPLVIVGLALFYLDNYIDMVIPTFGLGFNLTLGHLLIVGGFILGLYLFIRGSMAPITGALDRGVSLGHSFRITKRHSFIIFLTLVFLIALMLLAVLLLFHATGLTLAELDANALLTLPTSEKLILIAEVVSIRLLAAIIFVAVLSKLYVVISSKG